MGSIKRRRKKKPEQQYLFLQSSAIAAKVVEKAIEQYLESHGITWAMGLYPSGLHCYRVRIDSMGGWLSNPESLSDAIDDALCRGKNDLRGVDLGMQHIFVSRTAPETYWINQWTEHKPTTKRRRRRRA